MSVNIDITFKGPNGHALEGDIGPDAELKDFIEYVRKNQIRIAKAALAEEQAKGNLKHAFTIVDGKKGVAVESVKGLGKIQFVEPLSDLNFLADIYEAIYSRSPVDTGLYRSQHSVYYNNVFITDKPDGFQRWLDQKIEKGDAKAGDVILFVNVVPYARKLERLGITAGGASSRTRRSRDKLRYGKIAKNRPKLLAENGPYFLASRYASRKFGRNVVAKFELISGSRLANIPKFAKKSGSGTMRTSFKKTGDPYVYPSIKIVLTAEGISGGGDK